MTPSDRPTADVQERNTLQEILSVPLWLRGYGPRDLRGDVVAGLTVAVVLVPQSMAYALLAGVPPIYGLYASLVPLLVYPLFGTSMHLAVGVVAVDMILVSAGLSRLAEPGTQAYVEMAILLAMMVGVIQLIMGLGGMGFLVNLLSRPVIAGFMSGAAITIILSQMASLLGLPEPESRHALEGAWELLGGLYQLQWAPALLAGGSVAVLLALNRWRPLWPGPLIVVLLGGLIVWYLGLDREGVALVGRVPAELPSPGLPVITPASLRDLVPTAVALALVQFMTVITLGRTMASRFGYDIQPNRELSAIGWANLAGSFFRALPVSGSFSRTAVNAGAGARSPLANVVAAAAVGLTLLFLTDLLGHLPVPVLGAIIIVAAVGLVDVEEIRYLWGVRRREAAIAVLTFAVTLIVGVQEGILTGIAASVVAVMYRVSRPNTAVLGHLPGTRSFRDLEWTPDARTFEGVLILRVDASFSFANAAFVKDLVLRVSRKDTPPVHAVILDASSVNDLDTTAASVLAEVKEELKDRGIRLLLGGVKETVLETMKRSGLYERLGADTFFLSPHRALKDALGREGTGSLEQYLDEVPGSHEAEAAKEPPASPSAETRKPRK